MKGIAICGALSVRDHTTILSLIRLNLHAHRKIIAGRMNLPTTPQSNGSPCRNLRKSYRVMVSPIMKNAMSKKAYSVNRLPLAGFIINPAIKYMNSITGHRQP